MLKDGFVLEDAFLLQAKRDYEEFRALRATREMDMKHGTDVLLHSEDKVIPVGLTLKMDPEKVIRDANKASRMWNLWVEVVVAAGEEWDIAIDNALSFLANDFKENQGFFCLTASADGVFTSKL